MSQAENTCSYTVTIEDWKEWGGNPEVWEDIIEMLGFEDSVWKCQHKSFKTHQRCVFHLSPEEVPDELDEAQKMLDAIRNTNIATTERNQKSNQFLGAKFGNLNFDGVNLLMNDDYPLVLIGADFTADVNFNNVSFGGGATFSKATFANSADFQHTSFKNIDFSDTYFNGQAQFSDVDFSENASFSNTNFGEGTSFQNATFKANCDFSDVKFKAKANFVGSTFNERATFSDGKFGVETHFEDCEFKSQAWFWGIEVKGKVDYTGATFRDKAYFYKADFGSDPPPSETEQWKEHLAIQRKELKDGAIFTRVEFFDTAVFQNAVFYGEAHFQSKFNADSSFRRSMFLDNCIFSRALFNGTAFFGRVVFNNGANFKNSEFNDNVSFSNSEFNGSTEFTKSSLTQSNFSDISLRDADFSRTDLTDATLTDADFRQTNIENSRLSRATLFGTDLRGAKLSGAVLGDVRIDGDTKFLGYPSDDSDTSPHTFSAIRSRPKCVYDPDYKEDNEHEDVDKAKSIYRALEELGGKHTRLRLQARSFVRRKDLQKNEYKQDAKETDSWEERLIAGIRWSRAKVARATLLYGESPWRVIGWSLGIIFSFALLYPLGGWMKAEGANEPLSYSQIPVNFLSEPLGWLGGFLNVLADTFYYSTLTFTALGFGDFKPVDFGRTLTTIETGLGAVLLALLVFILGRRAAR